MYSKSDITHLNIMADLELREAPKVPTWKLDMGSKKTSGLNEKILLLCSKLRSDGFDKQADALEDKFAMYAVASKDDTTGYHVDSETGEELVERAHPEGDVEVADATDDLGDVETIVSRQNKDVEIMKKQPTGKLASYLPRIEFILFKQAGIADDFVDNLLGASYLSTGFAGMGLLSALSELINWAGMSRAVDSAKSALFTLKNKKTLPPDLINDIENFALKSADLKIFSDKISSLRKSEQPLTNEQFEDFKKSLNEIFNMTVDLKLKIKKVQDLDESSVGSMIWHTITDHNYNDAIVALLRLEDAISDLKKKITILNMKMEKTDKPNLGAAPQEEKNSAGTPNTSSPNSDKKSGDPLLRVQQEHAQQIDDFKAKKQKGINQVLKWNAELKNMNIAADKKKKVESWIAAQFAEFQKLQDNDNEKLNELLKDNELAGNQLKFLQGKVV